MRVTINKVNQALKDQKITAELVRGDGYFYFVGDSLDISKSSSVYVYHLNSLTVEDWVEECKQRLTVQPYWNYGSEEGSKIEVEVVDLGPEGNAELRELYLQPTILTEIRLGE
jgi:hypothetical protein